MKITKHFLIVILVSIMSFSVKAQQDPMYNQYIFNAYTINPAEAGIRAYGTASFLHRWQWVGIKGAPSTTSMGVETSFRSNWGFGLNAITDKIGPESNQTVNLSLGYHINLSSKYNLAMGLNGVANQRRLDALSFDNVYDADDPDLQSLNIFRPNMGGGLLVYSDHLFFGVSVPRLVQYKTAFGDTNLALDQVRHLFVYTGRIFDMSEKVKLKPSVLMKVVGGAPVQFDVNGVVSLSNIVDLGFNYRLGDGLGLISGITFKERFILNYAYEIPLTLIRNSSKQTHEIGIRYRFGRAHLENVQSPRFFN
ncbi:MAG: type IX secretion system membrane protein PorP/SprF [Cyclobacteriaceae bacterium]